MSAEVKGQETKKVLIIENDESLLALFEDLFKYEGFNVHSEQDTEDIITLAKEFQPDIVVLDYMLPGINGGELCAQLKRDPETSSIPVVICSAYAPVLLSLGSYGCNAFLPKPFELTELMLKVRECLAEPHKVFDMEQMKRVSPI